jgi:hypothetical protein
LYLNISNIGVAASSISNIKIRYKRNRLFGEKFKVLRKVINFDNINFKNSFLNEWSEEIPLTVALEDFYVKIDNDLYKAYPFLIQTSFLKIDDSTSFLVRGQQTNGIVYFESIGYWGGFEPKNCDGMAIVEVQVISIFKTKYHKIFQIPIVEVDEAKKYNKRFGDSINALNKNS